MKQAHLIAAILTPGLLFGCADTPTAPTASTASPSPAPAPATVSPQISLGPPAYTLSGVVSETSAAGPLPVADALVEVGVCAPSRVAAPARVITTRTDSNGRYRVSDVCGGIADVWVTKSGYRTQPPEQCDGDCLIVSIDKDTQFDVQLIR